MLWTDRGVEVGDDEEHNKLIGKVAGSWAMLDILRSRITSQTDL
jgi:hypothetical protein